MLTSTRFSLRVALTLSLGVSSAAFYACSSGEDTTNGLSGDGGGNGDGGLGGNRDSASGNQDSGPGAQDSGPRTGTPCEQLVQAFCPLLVACPEKAGSEDCTIYDHGEGFSHARGFTCSQCTSHLLKDTCGDTTKSDAFFNACLGAIDANKVVCGDEPNNAGTKALLLPPECSTFNNCDAGPCLD